MRKMLCLLGVVAMVVQTGCATEEFSFGGLTGSYHLEDGCFVTMSGGKGVASCERTVSDGSWSEDQELTVDVSIDEDSFSGTAVFVGYQGSDSGTGDCDSFKCTTTYTGSASKSTGRQVEGTFQAIAGIWTGTVQKKYECVSLCDPPDDYYDDNWTETYEIGADIFGSSANICHSWDDSCGELTGEWNDTSVVVMESGVISIDGYEFPKQ